MWFCSLHVRPAVLTKIKLSSNISPTFSSLLQSSSGSDTFGVSAEVNTGLSKPTCQSVQHHHFKTITSSTCHYPACPQTAIWFHYSLQHHEALTRVHPRPPPSTFTAASLFHLGSNIHLPLMCLTMETFDIHMRKKLSSVFLNIWDRSPIPQNPLSLRTLMETCTMCVLFQFYLVWVWDILVFLSNIHGFIMFVGFTDCSEGKYKDLEFILKN